MKFNLSKNVCLLLVAMLFVLSLAGCDSKKTEEASKDASAEVVSTDEINYDEQEIISIATGSSGGSYYMVGTVLAEVIQKHDPKLICSSETTGGTSENISLVSS